LRDAGQAGVRGILVLPIQINPKNPGAAAMSLSKVMLDIDDRVLTPEAIKELIASFGESYTVATKDIIDKSQSLDQGGETFIWCAARILSNFGMTRAGIFHRDMKIILRDCWNVVGLDLLEIKASVNQSGLSRGRYLVELGAPEREALFDRIWRITKKLLPFSMGDTSYGLVGASKILFSVLPEIVLPVDNTEWLKVFKTVDLGDVLRIMVADIQEWEVLQGVQLPALDDSKHLTTLPAVYNVLAMEARPRITGSKK